MTKLASLLAAAALALALWQTLEGQSLRAELAAVRQETTALRGELATLARETPDAPPVPSTRIAAAPEGLSPDDGPTLVASAARPEELARAVRDLQERVSAQEERVEDVVEQIAEDAEGRPVFRAPRLLRSVDDATKALELTPGQQSDVERVVRYAKEDLERLFEIPNAEGKTLADVSKPVALENAAQSGIGVLLTNIQAVSAFKNTEVPGTGETYAEAENRIRGEAKREIRDLLEPKQQASWDASYPDALFGPSRGGTISISTVTTRSGDDAR